MKIACPLMGEAYYEVMDEIRVHLDDKLMEFQQRFVILDSEHIHLLIDRKERNESGRTLDEIESEMMAVLRQTNDHLQTNYPDNTVAATWIATNGFHIKSWEELN